MSINPSTETFTPHWLWLAWHLLVSITVHHIARSKLRYKHESVLEQIETKQNCMSLFCSHFESCVPFFKPYDASLCLGMEYTFTAVQNE
jgi:hypothetical protein